MELQIRGNVLNGHHFIGHLFVSPQARARRPSWRLAISRQINDAIWRRDLCDEHADPIIANAKALGVEVFWTARATTAQVTRHLARAISSSGRNFSGHTSLTHRWLTSSARASILRSPTYAACQSFRPSKPCAKSRPQSVQRLWRMISPSCVIWWGRIPSSQTCVRRLLMLVRGVVTGRVFPLPNLCCCGMKDTSRFLPNGSQITASKTTRTHSNESSARAYP
jgi:hypothetical protein